MDCSKFLELFNPSKVRDRIHIIGCGSVGSTIAELLMRYGLKKFDLYDFDFVEEKNIANQMFRQNDVGQPKVEALKDLMVEINPCLLYTSMRPRRHKSGGPVIHHTGCKRRIAPYRLPHNTGMYPQIPCRRFPK